jgi:hypothetical protein
MRLIKYLLIVTLIFMVMAFWVGKVAAYDMAQYICSLHEGDWWEGVYTYTDVGGPNDGESASRTQKEVINGIELVNGVETIKKEIIVNDSVVSYYTTILDSEGFKLHKNYVPSTSFYFIFDPPSTIFPINLDVGDLYQSSCSIFVYSINTDAHMDTSVESRSVSLESVEDVTVPAGTFKDCLKIVTSASSESPTSGIITSNEETSWYAHKVGRIKTERVHTWLNLPVGDIETTSTWELTDYDVNFPTDCPMTIALGSDSKDLKTLRKFRDEVLSKTPAGQEIVKLYYQWSTVIVKAMEQDEGFKEDVKEMIEDILPMIKRKME